MHIHRQQNQRLKLALSGIFFVLAAAPLLIGRLTQATAAQEKRVAQADAASQPAERFDLLVRADFFAGLAGDQARFDKAMKLCEEMLAKNPKHAEALVWHGAGLLNKGGRAFSAGDLRNGNEWWTRGEKEMNDAIALDPNNISTRIPRGAVLLEGSKYVPVPAQAKAMLETALADYEKTLELQQAYFDKLGVHARGELLWGLADGWWRFGERTKAQAYAQRIVRELGGSGYVARAQALLNHQPLPQPPGSRSCIGCHAQ